MGISRQRVTAFCQNNGLAVYVSDKQMRSKGEQARRMREKRAKAETYICAFCGKEYIRNVRRHGDQGKKYCSRDCAFKDQAAWRRRAERKSWPSCKVYFLTCEICGKRFTTNKKGALVCSMSCLLLKGNKKAYIRAKAQHQAKIIKCKECGKVFTGEYGDKKKVYCSVSCGTKYHQRIGKGVRRARKFSRPHENISPVEIFQRDGWRCQICRVKTPARLRGTTNDRAPELDHIVALANGGSHLKSNTQCLCRRCNQEKGIETRGQLRMFG